MQQADEAASKQLFRDACRRCFGHDLTAPPSATERKLFCTRVLQETGLPIDWKSIQKPTVFTLDTLARFVLEAPYTDENTQKTKEGHCPYWFRYKEEFHRHLPARVSEAGFPVRHHNQDLPEGPARPKGLAQRFFFHTFRGTEQFLMWGRLLIPERIRHSWLAGMSLAVFMGLVLIWAIREHYARERFVFSETFSQTEGDSLRARGWSRQFPDSIWWARREEAHGALTLFTLPGDNWPDSAYPRGIRNLLLRPLAGDCFTTEVHFSDFFPTENGQQAGVLLMEDSSLGSRSVRLSIAYNDYVGGFSQPRQVIVEGISSAGNPLGKPEEILHKTLYLLGLGKDSLVRDNMRNTALRIEKKGTTYRFLYSGGRGSNFAFQEVGSRDLYITPRYVALFALKGYGDTSTNLPVRVRYFSLQIGPCEP
jgi:hypothetical protein